MLSRNMTVVIRNVYMTTDLAIDYEDVLSSRTTSQVCTERLIPAAQCSILASLAVQSSVTDGLDFLVENAILDVSGRNFGYLGRGAVRAKVVFRNVSFFSGSNATPGLVMEHIGSGAGFINNCATWYGNPLLGQLLQPMLAPVFGTQCLFAGAVNVTFEDVAWSLLRPNSALVNAFAATQNLTVTFAGYDCGYLAKARGVLATALPATSLRPRIIVNATACPSAVALEFDAGRAASLPALSLFVTGLPPLLLDLSFNKFDQITFGGVGTAVRNLTITRTSMSSFVGSLAAFLFRLRYLDLRLNSLASTRTVEELLAATPQLETIDVAGNRMRGTVTLGNITRRPVAITIEPAASSLAPNYPANLPSVMYTCGEDVAPSVRYWRTSPTGGPPYVATSAGPYDLAFRACRCNVGFTWDLSKGDGTEGCLRTPTASLSLIASSSPSSTPSQTPSTTASASRTLPTLTHSASPTLTQPRTRTRTPRAPVPTCASVITATILPPSLSSAQLSTTGATVTITLTSGMQWDPLTVPGSVHLRVTAATSQTNGFNSHADAIFRGPASIAVRSGSRSGASALEIKLFPAPALQIVGRDAEQLRITIASIAFACAGADDTEFVLDILPTSPPRLQAAERTATAAAAMGTAAGVVTASSAADMQAIVLLSLVQCASTSAKTVAGGASFLLGPLSLGGGSQGVVGGNLLLLFSFAALQLAVACGAHLVLRLRHRHVGKWHVCLAWVRFPGLTITAGMLQQQGTAAHALRMLFDGNASPLAIAGLALSLLLPAAIFYCRRYAQSTFGTAGGSAPKHLPEQESGDLQLVFYKYCTILKGVGPGTLKWRLVQWLGPIGRWGPKLAVSRIGSPYKALRPVWAGFATAAPLQGLLLGVIAGLPVRSGQTALCSLQLCAIAFVTTSMAVAAALSRPYRTAITPAFQVASSLCITVATIANIGMVARSGEPPGAWLELAAIAAALQGVVSLIRSLHALTLRVLENHWWDHDGRTFVWVEDMRRFVPERELDDALVELVASNAPDETADAMRTSTRHNKATHAIRKNVKAAGAAHSGDALLTL
jgi:hypothetical protein